MTSYRSRSSNRFRRWASSAGSAPARRCSRPPRGGQGLNSFNRGYDRLQLVRVYLAVGEPEQAMDEIERLLELPGYVTRAWLKLDPLFASLRTNPRFQRMVSGG